eukprot:scaffold6089_cov298-Prasinococcus_capsulatus_cf.AAC.2
MCPACATVPTGCDVSVQDGEANGPVCLGFQDYLVRCVDVKAIHFDGALHLIFAPFSSSEVGGELIHSLATKSRHVPSVAHEPEARHDSSRWEGRDLA